MSDAIKSGALTGVLTGTLVTIPNVAQAAAEAAPAGITIAQAAPIFLGGCVVGAVAGGAVSHFATARALRSGEAVRASEEAEQARHSAAESQEEPAGSGRRPGKHFRDANWEQQGSIRVQNVEDSTVLHVPDFVKNIDSSSAKPASDAPRTVAESVPEVVSDSEDYGDVAEKYVRRMTFRERMSTRAKGVKAVLQDRLAGDMMDGLPVIRRADGTTGDVGTSWWEAAVGDSVRRDSIDSDFLEDTTAHEVEERPLVPRRIVDPADPRETAPAATATAPAAQNRQTPQESISARVAQVDEGVFPEHRDLDDLAKSEDSFEAALKALDERIALQVPIEFDDEVGGADTIDEPEGLEGSTSFIPFRMPAGHPEVVDTDSYVDYLIDDEFSQNPSNAVRRGAKTFLRVIEGGSQKLGDTHPQKKTEHHASHFAEAKEA
jgi:hypothetical protein